MRYIVAGFGKFGRLAVQRLNERYDSPEIMVVEPHPLPGSSSLPENVTSIGQDAVHFLSTDPHLADDDIIVPMVPFHLAARFVTARTSNCRETPLPVALGSLTPNPFVLDAANLCCSRADFLCPDDCPEGELCTVTGLLREPLYEDLEGLDLPGFTVLVLRSFQILPGVGGFYFRDLCSVQERIVPGSFVLVTSCKCHAIVTGLQVSP